MHECDTRNNKFKNNSIQLNQDKMSFILKNHHLYDIKKLKR